MPHCPVAYRGAMGSLLCFSALAMQRIGSVPSHDDGQRFRRTGHILCIGTCKTPVSHVNQAWGQSLGALSRHVKCIRQCRGEIDLLLPLFSVNAATVVEMLSVCMRYGDSQMNQVPEVELTQLNQQRYGLRKHRRPHLAGICSPYST